LDKTYRQFCTTKTARKKLPIFNAPANKRLLPLKLMMKTNENLFLWKNDWSLPFLAYFILDKLFYYFFFMLCSFNIYYAHHLFSYLYPNGNYYRVIFLSLNVHYVFCSFLFSFVSYNKTNAIF